MHKSTRRCCVRLSGQPVRYHFGWWNIRPRYGLQGAHTGGTWNVSVLYNFEASGDDGQRPEAEVVLDSAGNLYGTTFLGGAHGYGTVFKLSPSGGGWTETVLHTFADDGDGCGPYGGLVFDRAGNLYGATSGATTYYVCRSGTVFELSPQGGGWNFTTIYTFSGYGPESSLTLDATWSQSVAHFPSFS